jgi:hypothetical protein
MASVSEISDKVREFLNGGISFEEFEEWSASYSWDIHQRAGQKIQDLAYAVRGVLVEYSSGDIDEKRLREDLENTIRPFAVIRVSVPTKRIVFGKPQGYALSSNASIELEAALIA